MHVYPAYAYVRADCKIKSLEEIKEGEININLQMERQVITTADGSSTVSIPEMNVTYHSTHGAIQESMHVFIQAGLNQALSRYSSISILEMGFGTGLNALLTLIESEAVKKPVHYSAIELYPLEPEQIKTLNYCEQLDRKDLIQSFEILHISPWEEDIQITEYLTLYKSGTDLLKFETPRSGQLFHIIYFDAFAPTAQPELWTSAVFEKLFALLSLGGLLVTYCSKGDVRRAMQSAGFRVEKLTGPPGKREMVRAWKEM
jgi:tRNA U34 5-methylaminomethyl-2-thiouridine-forming methyltransferase MnmC